MPRGSRGNQEAQGQSAVMASLVTQGTVAAGEAVLAVQGGLEEPEVTAEEVVLVETGDLEHPVWLSSMHRL